MNIKSYIETLCFIVFVSFSIMGNAQQPIVGQRHISEGNLQISFVSPQIIRMQVSDIGTFNMFEPSNNFFKDSNVKVARHEDRIRIETDLLWLDHNPQHGISFSNSPTLVIQETNQKVYPLSVNPLSQKDINRGFLIFDNLKDSIFPVAESVSVDRIIITTINTFVEELQILKDITGYAFDIKDNCKTPQIYFKPVKGSAMLHIESCPGATIYFTRDGSTPTYNSEVYEKPQFLKSSARVIAFATDDKHLPSEIAEAQIVMSKARDISWRHEYSDEYCGLGEYALMDGIRGNPKDYTNNWIGVPKHDMSVEVELNKTMALSMLGIGFFQQPEQGIFIPERVTIEVSCDGRRYHKVYRNRIKTPDAPYHHWTHNITARFRPREVKYIRIYAEENDDIRVEEHFLDGMKWIFVDEIIFEQHAEKERVATCREKK